MDVFSVLTMLGGLALFIFGMHQMGEGLQKVAGSRLEKMLGRMTSGRLRGVLLGIGITAIIQSSSATTVTVVGFVNSGIMQLNQAIPVIMGANIGTTVTSWILSLAGIEGTNLFVQFLKPSSFTPVLALVGVGMLVFSKNAKRREVGGILAGFAILMFGMETMTDAVKPLAQLPEFTKLFTMFENPILGMLAGVVLTAIIQSSSASVGILQALAATGGVSFAAAIPIIMGQNIGTCVTALLSSIGASKAARRAAMVHLYFNLIGSVSFMILFIIFGPLVPSLDRPVTIMGIAVIHSIFNITTTAALLPFTNFLEKLADLTIRDKSVADKPVLLDERLLATPAFAVSRCRELTGQMANKASGAILDSLWLLNHYDEQTAAHIDEAEGEVDRYEDALGTFCVKLSNRSLSDSEGLAVSRILHGIGDFERISDHAVNLKETAQEIAEKGVEFTEEARKELETLFNALREILDISIGAYNLDDVSLAKRVEPLEEVIDELIDELKLRHVRRLRQGKCTVETGFVFADLLNNCERVADHCSNLGVCVIELNQNEYNAHEYIEKTGKLADFGDMYAVEKEKYALPEPAYAER